MKSLILVFILLSSLTACAKDMTPEHHGREQGRSAGRREGEERGRPDGEYDGSIDGLPAGIIAGQQILVDAAASDGLAQGQAEGSAVGAKEGRESGLAAGEGDGRAEGESKARDAADAAALVAVTEPATAAGKARAALADPRADGLKQGSAAGLEHARQEANAKDFARARDDYRKKQFGLPVKGKSSVRQAPLAVAPSAWPLDGKTFFGGHRSSGPDYRYARYGSDNEEYQRAYREGYKDGFRDGYNSGYDYGYRVTYDRSFAIGTSQATVVNLQDTVDQAFQQGFEQAREASFKAAQTAAFKEAYKPAYDAAYASAYANFYPQFVTEHSRDIEEATYQAVYGPPFQEAFKAAEALSFTDNYPKQAKLAYDEGWKAEARDFASRPVRILEAWMTPTDVEGVKLLTVRVRNFSDKMVAGTRVRVSLGAQTSKLFHPIPPGNEMTVTGLLRVRTDVPGQADLFAVIETDGKRIPLGTVTVATTAPAE